MTLSQRLRTETSDAHRRAERSGVMRRVLRGDIGRDDYVALLASLGAVYEALERELDRHASDPALASFDLGPLRRVDAIRRDLAALAPHHAVEPDASAVAYAARLRALGDSAPLLLLAHAYVRYLGDLSGGQILRGVVRRALSLDHDAGTAFYDFAGAGEPEALKNGFRRALDALPADASDALVAEALEAFAMHERLFTALDAPR